MMYLKEWLPHLDGSSPGLLLVGLQDSFALTATFGNNESVGQRFSREFVGLTPGCNEFDTCGRTHRIVGTFAFAMFPQNIASLFPKKFKNTIISCLGCYNVEVDVEIGRAHV